MKDVKDRSVVITGVSSGIGLATARLFLQQGVQVYGSVRRKEDAGSLVAEYGSQFMPLVMDITDASQVQVAVRAVQAGLQGRTLCGLINNAGYAQGPDPLSLIPLDKLRSQLEVNVVAQLRVTQAFLPLLGTDPSRQGAPGRVCMMSSVYGSYSIPWNGPYCASKHALEGLSGALRQELRTYGIRVVVLRPGPIKTAIWEGSSSPESARDWHAYDDTDYAPAMAKTAKYKQKWLSHARNFLAPEDVAACCCKAMCARVPKAHYVVTPRPLENWYLPRWLPAKMVDGSLAKRFGIRGLARSARKDELEQPPLLRKEE